MGAAEVNSIYSLGERHKNLRRGKTINFAFGRVEGFQSRRLEQECEKPAPQECPKFLAKVRFVDSFSLCGFKRIN
jgi:hypothetical protein